MVQERGADVKGFASTDLRTENFANTAHPRGRTQREELNLDLGYTLVKNTLLVRRSKSE
jgi:hypothetical protein